MIELSDNLFDIFDRLRIDLDLLRLLFIKESTNIEGFKMM